MLGTSSKNTTAISSAQFGTDWHILLAVSSLMPSRSPICRASAITTCHAAPGRSGVLPPLSPLRTVRDSFPSYGSSLSKGSPWGTARLYNLLSGIHGPQFAGRHCRQQFAALIVPSTPEVPGVFLKIGVCIGLYLDVSLDTNGVQFDNLINRCTA